MCHTTAQGGVTAPHPAPPPGVILNLSMVNIMDNSLNSSPCEGQEPREVSVKARKQGRTSGPWLKAIDGEEWAKVEGPEARQSR